MTDWKAKYEDLNQCHENYASELAKNKTLLEQVECLKQVEVDHEESKRIIAAVIETMNERKNDLWSGAEMFINQGTVENQLLNVIGRCANMQVEFDRLRECTAFEAGGYIELMNTAIGAMQHGQDDNMRAALASADAELVELRKQHEELRQCLGDANKTINDIEQAIDHVENRGAKALVDRARSIKDSWSMYKSWILEAGEALTNHGIQPGPMPLRVEELIGKNQELTKDVNDWRAARSRGSKVEISAQAQLDAICAMIDAEPEEGEPIESIRLAVKAMNGWEGHCDHWHEDIAQLVEYVDAFMNHCPEDLEPEGVREHWEWLNEDHTKLVVSLHEHRDVMRTIAYFVGMEKITHASTRSDYTVCDHNEMLQKLFNLKKSEDIALLRTMHTDVANVLDMDGESIEDVAADAVLIIEEFKRLCRESDEEGDAVEVVDHIVTKVEAFDKIEQYIAPDDDPNDVADIAISAVGILGRIGEEIEENDHNLMYKTTVGLRQECASQLQYISELEDKTKEYADSLGVVLADNALQAGEIINLKIAVVGLAKAIGGQ